MPCPGCPDVNCLILAGDGTTGVALKRRLFSHAQKSATLSSEQRVRIVSSRFERMVCPMPPDDHRSDRALRNKARASYLKACQEAIKGNDPDRDALESAATMTPRKRGFYDSDDVEPTIPKEISELIIWIIFDSPSHLPSESRKVLLRFCVDLLKDQSVTELLPLRFIPSVERFVASIPTSPPATGVYRAERESLQSGLLAFGIQPLSQFMEVLHDEFQFRAHGPAFPLCLRLFRFILDRTKTVGRILCPDIPLPLSSPSATAPTASSARASPIPGSYNPTVFLSAYYFRPTGERVRNTLIDTDDDADCDADDTRCEKKNPAAAKEARFFFVFCPLHGHCWGFHVIDGGEGRKDFYKVMRDYLDKAPRIVFYDFACNLSEYCLNRDPAFFKDTKFYSDVFHGTNHKCASTMKTNMTTRRVLPEETATRLALDTSICEQFNHFISSLSRSVRHMTPEIAIPMVQIAIHEWNLAKKRSFQLKKEINERNLVSLLK